METGLRTSRTLNCAMITHGGQSHDPVVSFSSSQRSYSQLLNDNVFSLDELRPFKGEIESPGSVSVIAPSSTRSLGSSNYSCSTWHSPSDPHGEGKNGCASCLAGLGEWCEDSPKRPLLNDAHLTTIFEELEEAEKHTVQAGVFGYLHIMRHTHDHLKEMARTRSENQDVTRRGPSSSSGRTSEYVPSLITDISTTGNTSAFEDEPSGQHALYPRPISDPSLPRVEISLPEVAHLTDDERYFCYEQVIERFTNARKYDFELNATCAIGVQEGDRFDVDSDTESAEELWLSDYSDHTLIIEEDHPIWQRHGNLILRAILLAFQKRGESCDQEQDGHNRALDTQTLCSSTLQPSESQAVPNKRSFNKYSEDETRGSSESLETNSKNSRSANRKRLFACPFCKKNPLRYRSCYSLRLTKISYVKQHISKNHPFPTYCPVCMETFETPQARDAHARAQNCQRRPLLGWEGVTEAHRQQMRRKPPKGTSEEEQWFMIFKMLFPELPFPSSPYIDGDLSEQLFAFQDFAVSQGPNIVRETLGPQAETLFLTEIEPLIQRVVTEGIPAIVQHFILSRQSRSESESISPINESSRSCGPISNGNFALSTNCEGSNSHGSNDDRAAEDGSDITILRDSTADMVAQTTAVSSDGLSLQRSVTEAGGMNAFDSLSDAQMGDLSDEIQGYLNNLVEDAETNSWINNDYYEDSV